MTDQLTYEGWSDPMVLWLCQNMRKSDAAEIYAQRPDENAFALYRDLAAIGRNHLWFELARPATSMSPVALFGVAGVSPGVAQAHMFGTDALTLGHARQIADRIKSHVIPALLDLGLHRVQAYSLADYAWAHRFLQRSGAKFEAPCWSLGASGQDFASFVWLRKDLAHLYETNIEETGT
ncbi:hypothetical protein [Roseobacter sp.]|uniref:hypothetical protein n=1 Tax=Roseobacter sp. TaxID=1907202 RepID=UPI0029663B09|nr:hypothetical protein [Roseobacter sp.]MDW3181764.1 hypothetical protein [Roseobacter sp.]